MTESFAVPQIVIEVIYLVASALFILSLRWMSCLLYTSRCV